jgi:hypothetical protein
MKENTFAPFNPDIKGIKFLTCIITRFGVPETTRRIHDILQQIKVRADVKELELTKTYKTIFGNEKKEHLGWEFQIIFDPNETAYKKELAYAAMVGFNFGYWRTGI